MKMKNQCVRKQIGLFVLSLVSAMAMATTIGTLTFNESDCTDSGLEAEFIGIGGILNGVFITAEQVSFNEGTPVPVYQCGAPTSTTGQQIIRNHTTVTFEHILFAAPDLWGMDGESDENKIAASSDKSTEISFWGTSNLTQISEAQGTHFDTDIYQFTAGFDKAVGDLFFGSSLAYAYTSDEQGTTTSTSNTVGFTPYAAYKINDYLFASALAGYLYTHTNRVDGGNDLDTHDYVTEGNLNAFKVINSFILKGRVGVRYNHTITSPEIGVTGRDNSFDQLTWVGDGEIGYQLTNKLRIYTGLLYEYYDREASGASTRVRDSIAFMRYGVEYPVSNDLTLGAKIQHDINDEDSDYITGSINARLAF